MQKPAKLALLSAFMLALSLGCAFSQADDGTETSAINVFADSSTLKVGQTKQVQQEAIERSC